MSIPYIIANWKMNIPSNTCRTYALDLEKYLVQYSNTRVVICPPAVSLSFFSEVNPTKFFLGVQNFYPADYGSFTGEHSLTMFDSFGTSYAIIGHSERRILFKEDDSLIAKKIQYAVNKNYGIILCVGETIEERKQGITRQQIEQQLEVLTHISRGITCPICIAYEPLWAIGSGRIPNLEDIALCMEYIRTYVKENLDLNTKNVYTLYGGSVNQCNVASILAVQGVDGVLVGNASLELDVFIAIIERSM